MRSIGFMAWFPDDAADIDRETHRAARGPRAAHWRAHIGRDEIAAQRASTRNTAMPEAWIIDACRTPRGIGKQGKGALAHLHPQHLAATVLEALAERNGFDTADVDDVIWGTSSQVCEQSGDLGRMAALDAGYDVRASGVTLDRFCGSGITANNFAAAHDHGRAWRTSSSAAAPR